MALKVRWLFANCRPLPTQIAVVCSSYFKCILCVLLTLRTDDVTLQCCSLPVPVMSSVSGLRCFLIVQSVLHNCYALQLIATWLRRQLRGIFCV